MLDQQEKYRAPALEKGLDIIELLSLHADGLSRGDIAKALNKSNSEIYRMLSTLVRRGYVLRSVDDLYSLSLRMFALSQRHPPIQRLLEAATPRMRAASEKAWQSCHLAVENNADIVVIASAESPGNWSLALRPGTIIGLGNTSAGRILAAFRTDQGIEELLKRHRLATGEPELKHAEFLSHISRVRTWGYERMKSETAVGVTNLAYPILSNERHAVAVVVCPFLERIDELKVPSVEEAHEIFSELARSLSNFYNGHLAIAG
ncbi:MAG: IclR family transcriptional regulator [Aestuariivita sp.]|nr:IclR family transcriptional regulator [Aestuariivita sp.]